MAAASCSWGIVFAAPSSDFSHYYYFKEERPLRLDASRIAILDAGALSTERVDRFLKEAGYSTPKVERQPIRGWSLFESSSASATPELVSGGAAFGAVSVAETISRLLELDKDERFFFAPVFTGAFGPVVPTPTILAQFDHALSETQVAQVLNEVGLGNLSWRFLGSTKNALEIEPRSRSGIEILMIANALAVRPEVLAAEPNMMFNGRSGFIPNDPNFAHSWGLHNTGQLGGTADMDIDAPEAWERNKGSGGVFIIIIDTGVDEFHPDLHQLGGIDVTSDDGNGSPVNACDNHGTPVAGTVGSEIDNGLGTAGVAPHAWVLSARTFIANLTCDGTWSSISSWTVDALDWAQAINARVTNNSNFYGFQSSAIAAKYQETRDVGIVHFASVGNSATKHVEWPAALSSVNAITAISSNGDRASFSSWGAEVALTGPGEDIFTTDRLGADGWTNGDYVPNAEGTSFSSPFIAGVAALLVSEASSLDANEVEALLRASAVDLGAPGWDEIFGWGLPKASAALEALDLFSDSFESGDTSQWSSSEP